MTDVINSSIFFVSSYTFQAAIKLWRWKNKYQIFAESQICSRNIIFNYAVNTVSSRKAISFNLAWCSSVKDPFFLRRESSNRIFDVPCKLESILIRSCVVAGFMIFCLFLFLLVFFSHYRPVQPYQWTKWQKLFLPSKMTQILSSNLLCRWNNLPAWKQQRGNSWPQKIMEYLIRWFKKNYLAIGWLLITNCLNFLCFRQAFMNICKSFVGAGMLALPYAMRQSGILVINFHHRMLISAHFFV